MTISQAAPVNLWREAVLDRLTVLCMDAPQDEPPASILRRIIAAEVEIALDPSVSDVAPAAAPEPEPVMEFKGRRLTPEGTRECWGMLLCKPEQDPARGALLYAAPPAAPVVPVSWDRLRVLMDSIPTREEFIGGQRQKYVAKEEVMGWLYESQLRAEREAPPAAPAPVVPLTDGQIRQIVRDTFDVVPLPHDITFARAIEAAHGIGTTGGGK